MSDKSSTTLLEDSAEFDEAFSWIKERLDDTEFWDVIENDGGENRNDTVRLIEEYERCESPEDADKLRVQIFVERVGLEVLHCGYAIENELSDTGFKIAKWGALDMSGEPFSSPLSRAIRNNRIARIQELLSENDDLSEHSFTITFEANDAKTLDFVLAHGKNGKSDCLWRGLLHAYDAALRVAVKKQPVHERYLEFAKVLVKNDYAPVVSDIKAAYNGIEINERLFKRLLSKLD